MKFRFNGKKTKIENYLMILFSVFVFFDSYCYFTWDTLNNLTVNLLTKYIRAILIAVLFVYAVVELLGKQHNKNAGNISNGKIGALIILFLLITYLFVGGYSRKSTIIVAIAFILLSREKKEYIFKAALIAFALMVLPSMIYYLLENIGIHIPYTILLSTHDGKRESGWTYFQYPFGLICNEAHLHQINRYSGIFDESGYVGTLAALFIAGGYGKVNKKWLLLLTIEGIFSFSMAFYLLLIIFSLIRAFLDGIIRFCIIFLILIVGFNVFMHIDFDIPSFERMQNRIDLTSVFLVKDNRTSNSADVVFNDFFEDGGIRLLFGYGHGAASDNPKIYGSSSYKMFIYDYGIIGIILFALYFLSAFLCTKKVNISVLPFLLIFGASIYQRPYIFTAVYIVIFWGAVSSHSKTKFDGNTVNEQNKVLENEMSLPG